MVGLSSKPTPLLLPTLPAAGRLAMEEDGISWPVSSCPQPVSTLESPRAVLGVSGKATAPTPAVRPGAVRTGAVGLQPLQVSGSREALVRM